MRLASSTPFRLALVFALVLVLAFLLSGVAVYETMRRDLARRLDEAVGETYSVVAQTYGEGDLEDLVAMVDGHTRLGGKEQLFSLLDAGGRRLAGNFDATGMPAGFSNLREGSAGIPPETSFRAFSGRVGDNTLTVAFSHAGTDELEMIVLAGFGWATVVVVGLAIAGGALLATRVQHRLDAIAATMEAVSHGAMDARIPLIGNGDDIDGVSGQINAALDRLSALVHSVRQVGSDIAHELKTPLNRLQLVLEDAAATGGAGSNGSAIEDAQGEIRRINETFEALLRIAQIEAGGRKARFAPLDLDDVLRNIAEIYVDVAADEGRLLAAGPPTTRATILGDWELLTQMFANLVENAIRHTPRGTRIAMGLRREGTAVLAVVADDGPGIPAGERDKVFQRLYRMDKSRATPGTGLGLTLVKAVAELHGATVGLEDNGPGLRVAVRFPGL